MKITVTRSVFAILCILTMSPQVFANQEVQWQSGYDSYFQKYSRRYFGPYFDWRWFKAQAIAESGLDPEARSHRGALGLMQILPSTFEEIRDERPHFSNIEDPRWNIAAGIFYCRLLYEKWAGYPEEERLMLTFASYNTGYAGVLQAMHQLPVDAHDWQRVVPLLPGQTRAYVARIREIRGLEPEMASVIKAR